MTLDSRLAQQTMDRWAAEKLEAARSRLFNMGSAISGTTRWLNVRKLGPRVGLFPGVRKVDEDTVRLQVKWKTANKGIRRITARNLKEAKRHIWTSWAK